MKNIVHPGLTLACAALVGALGVYVVLDYMVGGESSFHSRRAPYAARFWKVIAGR